MGDKWVANASQMWQMSCKWITNRSQMGHKWVPKGLKMGLQMGCKWVTSWSQMGHKCVAIFFQISCKWVANGSQMGRTWIANGLQMSCKICCKRDTNLLQMCRKWFTIGGASAKPLHRRTYFMSKSFFLFYSYFLCSYLRAPYPLQSSVNNCQIPYHRIG